MRKTASATLRTPSGVVVLALLSFGVSAGAVAAQPVENVACDARAARSATDGPRGYAPRGDRCEGTFNREVSGSSFRVAGFYQFFGPIDTTERSLPMTWSSPEAGLVHLRVRSMREGGELLAMDTQFLPGTTSYSWPTDFVRTLRLEPAQLAPAAYVEVDDREMYLPLRIATPENGSAPTYTLTLLSVERMERLFVTVAPVERVGDLATGDFVVVNQPVSGAPYTSGRPITVSIAGLEDPGLYVAQVLGMTSDGNRRELNVWFYHDRAAAADPPAR